MAVVLAILNALVAISTSARWKSTGLAADLHPAARELERDNVLERGEPFVAVDLRATSGSDGELRAS